MLKPYIKIKGDWSRMNEKHKINHCFNTEDVTIMLTVYFRVMSYHLFSINCMIGKLLSFIAVSFFVMFWPVMELVHFATRPLFLFPFLMSVYMYRQAIFQIFPSILFRNFSRKRCEPDRPRINPGSINT